MTYVHVDDMVMKFYRLNEKNLCIYMNCNYYKFCFTSVVDIGTRI